MQRKDIKVGDELYYADPSDWKYDNQGGRVRVLSTDPHVQSEFRGPVAYKGANGVLVQFLDAQTGEPIPNRWYADGRCAVNVAHLRGPYAQTVVEVAARNAARYESANALGERRRAVTKAVTRVVDRARLDGWSSALDATHWQSEDIRNARVSLSLADFERMLNKIDELGRAAQELAGERDADGE